MVLQPSTSASNNLPPAWLSPSGFFSCLRAGSRRPLLLRQPQREGADRGRRQQHDRQHRGPCDQRGQAGLDDAEDEMTIAARNAEHDAPMMFAVMRSSKARAASQPRVPTE